MKKCFFAIVLLAVCAATQAEWRYSENEDQMSGKRITHAQLESNNSLKLEFPYAGTNYGRIYVRQHPKHGRNVLVTIDKGQILCNSYQGCSASIRFDDKPPMKFSASESGDHDSKVIFLNDAKRFIDAASKAKKVLVQVTIYQSGDQVLEFYSAAPLSWTPRK